MQTMGSFENACMKKDDSNNNNLSDCGTFSNPNKIAYNKCLLCGNTTFSHSFVQSQNPTFSKEFVMPKLFKAVSCERCGFTILVNETG